MKLKIIESGQMNPYLNLAVEEYLMSSNDEDTIIMYLWQNRQTVVIGQNQNPFAECRVELLEKEGGYVARRKTGGGAVYHDAGNLNFSFIAPERLYDKFKQFSIICSAVESYGVKVELSGRNDILCEGRKFSGCAFSKREGQNLHHGTLLIKTDTEMIQRYLTPKPTKLQKHGVKSVERRVVNLSELAQVTADNIKPKLIESFEKEYGQKATWLDYGELIRCDEVSRKAQLYGSDEWLYDRWRNFKVTKHGTFNWGEVDLQVTVDESKRIIQDLMIATDSLDTGAILEAKKRIIGQNIDHLMDEKCQSEVLRDIIEVILK